jgi:hypothetical protein
VDVFGTDCTGMIHTFAALTAISAGVNRALPELLAQFVASGRP